MNIEEIPDVRQCRTKFDAYRLFKLNKTNINNLNTLLQHSLSVHGKKKLEAQLVKLHSIDVKIRLKIKEFSKIRQQQQQHSNERSDKIIWKNLKSAFKKRIHTAAVINVKHTKLEEFLEDAGYLIKDKLKNQLRTMLTFKLNLVFCGEFIRPEQDTSEYKYLNSRNRIVNISTNLDDLLYDLFTEIILKLEEFQERNSGYALVAIVSMVVAFLKYVPLRGGVDRSTYTDLPAELRGRERNSKCILNIKNIDRKCFAWCILAHLFPIRNCNERNGKDPRDPSSYDQQNIHEVLNFTNI